MWQLLSFLAALSKYLISRHYYLVSNEAKSKKSVITKSTMCNLISIQGNFSVNRKGLRALTLVGQTRENLVLYP